MHKSRKAKVHARDEGNRHYVGKTTVFGVLDRELRQARAKVVPDVKRETLQNEILNQVHRGSKVYTDSAVGYDHLRKDFVHEVVNHAKEYVNAQVHTQGLDNFWSLLKRTLRGTYVAVEPFHLDRYLDEQVFRYNNRKTKDNPLTDSDRFALAMSQVGGRRLTYAELTGKDTDSVCHPEGRDGARGTVLALLLAGNLASRLLLRSRLCRYSCAFGPKNSRSEIHKVLASLRAFVVFVFHPYQCTPEVRTAKNAIAHVDANSQKPTSTTTNLRVVAGGKYNAAIAPLTPIRAPKINPKQASTRASA